MKRVSLEDFIPAIAWIKTYDREHLKGDISAGFTTAVMIVPQGMAYAMLAGLPPIMGLYASIIPVLLYALFGTSRQLAVGPVAMDSLLVFTSVSALATVGTEKYISYAIALAFIAGIIQVLMGIFRLGFLVNFLSKPVISGFTAAAALIIGFGQFKDLFGISIDRSAQIHTIIWTTIQQYESISLLTFAIASLSIVFMVVLKKVKPMFPRALAVVVLGGLATYLLDLSSSGVAVVGGVPPGLPSLEFPALSFQVFKDLLPTALIVALIGFMEAISIAKGIASKHGYDVDPNKELIGLGMANIGAGLFHGYTVTGGFSRTAVNDSAGAQTPLASMITAGIVTITLLYFTPLFYYLPKAALAAIIVSAVFGLIDIPLVRYFWAVKKSDFILYLITFVATLIFGIVIGLGAGIIASLLLIIARTTQPHFAVLGQIPGTTAYRKLENHENLKTYEGLLIIRMDAQLYFGNTSFLKSMIEAQIEKYKPLHTLILDMSGVNQIDTSGESALCEIEKILHEDKIALIFANTKKPVAEVLACGDLYRDLSEENFFLTVHDAVQAKQMKFDTP